MGSSRPRPARLASKLKQIRTSLGLSQTEIVKELNYKSSPLSAPQISHYENDLREPPILLVLAYARLANIPMESLVDDKLELR